MKTNKILRFTLQVLAIAGLLLGTQAFAASSTTFTLITGDASVGLTLDPANVVAARHFGNDNTNYTLQGVSFANNAGRPNSTSFSITGFSGFEFDGFHPGTPTLGIGTANDLALGAMCNSFYFGKDAGGGFNFKISGLAPFSTNKIEFIHYIGTFGPRNTVITVTNGASSLSETNTELVNKPLNSQFSGIVADSYGSISGRFQQGATPGDGSWINAIIVTFQGQGPVSTFSWSGITNGVPAGNWDVGSTTNWILSLSGNPIAWPNGGITRFDDSAAGTTTVNETTTLAPATLTVSNVAKSYTFTGTGAITGVKLIKQGTGILTVLSTNAFGNGNSEIQNGTVVFGNTSSNNVTGQLLVASVSNVVANLVLTSNANLIVSDAFNLGSSASSTGTVVIANNSVLRKTGGSISIGGAGVGIATIQDSAIFTANASDLNIGDLAGSAGTLNLQGSPQITVGGVYVGKGSGSGTADGVVNQTGGRLTSVLTGIGEFQIGVYGNGTWNQSGGTNSVAGFVAIGRWPGGNGTFIVSGNAAFNQMNTAKALIVGEAGNGTLTISNGLVSSLSTAYGLLVGYDATGSGTVNLDGGTLVVQLVAGGSGSGTFNFNGGTLKAGSAATTNFMSFLSSANVLAGGAVIDSDTNNITIAQTLNDGGGNGGLTKLGTGALTLTAGNNYTGPTAVNAGKLAITTATTGAGNYTVANSAELGLTVLGLNNQISSANMTLGSCALDFDLGSFGNPDSVIGSPWNVTGNLAVNSTVTVNLADANPQVGQFPLIKYGSRTGSGSFTIGALPLGVQATIVTNVGNSSIDLNIAAVKRSRWEGLAGGNWDVNITTNWIDFSSGLPAKFAQGNAALLNDLAAGTTAINLVATVTPAVVTVTNSVLNYSLGGSGKISGVTGLTKQGVGSLTVTNASGNDYTGVTRFEGGTLIANKLADGGTASSVGAASSSPTNLVFAGGTLSYVGSAVTINRGYTVQAASTLDVQSNLTLSGSVTATAGPFDKTGPATLTYTGVGNNTLANGGFPAYRVDAGQVVLAGANAQTNIVGGEFWITGGNLLLSNTVLQSSWVNVGRNATAGSITTLSLTNATINQITGGGFSAGYFEQPPGILTTQVVTFGGSSSLTAPGDGVIGWKANSSATLNLNNNSKISLAGDLYFAAEANSIATVNIKDTSLITVGGGVGGIGHGVFVAGYLYNADTNQTAIVNQSGGTVTNAAGDFLIGVQGAGTWNLSGGTVSSPSFVSIARFITSVGQLNVSGGTFNQAGTGTALIVGEQGTGTLNVSGSGVVNVASTAYGLVLGNSVSGVGTVNLNGGILSVARVQTLSGGSGTFNFNGGLLRATNANTNYMSGLVAANVLAGGAQIDSAGNSITITQPLLNGGGGGGLVKLGAGILLLNGSNTYTGLTTVSNGTLGGLGSIYSPVMVQPGATLSPGVGLGTLTIFSNLTLAGNVFVKVNKTNSPATNDQVVVSGTLTNSGVGTVTITNLGPTLVAGDSFKLFSKPVLNGAALTIISSGGVVWTNKLALDGSVRVVSVSSGLPPNFGPGSVTRLPDGNISLTATGALGSTYKLYTTTNLALKPVTNTWTLLNSGTVTASPFTINDLNATNYPQRFYLFSAP